MSQPSLSCLTQQQNWIWLTLKALASSTCFRGKYPEAAPQSFLVLENNLLVELLFVCIYGRICPVSASDCLQLQKWILKKFSTAFSTIQKSAKNKLPIWSHCRLLSRGYVCLTAEKKTAQQRAHCLYSSRCSSKSKKSMSSSYNTVSGSL